MGPSGSGKTTLLNCLSGLDDIDAGRVLIERPGSVRDERRRPDRAPGAARWASCSSPSTSSRCSPPWRTSSCRCCSSARTAGEARRRAMAMLARVGLTGRDRHRPERAVRRRAAARHDRPGAGRPARDRLGRRAHRQPGHGDGGPGDGPAAAAERRGGADASCWSPTIRRSAPRPTGWSGCATACSTPTSPSGRRSRRACVRRPAVYPELTVPLVVLTGAALGYVVLVVARQPVQRWLALRQVARRPTESVLVVLGAVLGTALLVASLAVGDSLNRSVRQSAYEVLGPIDEYVRTADPVQGAEVARRLAPLAARSRGRRRADRPRRPGRGRARDRRSPAGRAADPAVGAGLRGGRPVRRADTVRARRRRSGARRGGAQPAPRRLAAGRPGRRGRRARVRHARCG